MDGSALRGRLKGPEVALARGAGFCFAGGLMSPADRYSSLLPSGVRERWLLEAPVRWTELELQAFWFGGDFGREFRGTAGESVRIVQFGVWNREAGPDFSQAAVSIDGAPAVTGPIEFDTEARDWERHGHGQNADYEGVILHVFTEAGGAEFFTRTARHRRVPQVQVDVAMLRGPAPGALPEAKLGACAGPLAELPEERARAVVLGAAEYRFRCKTAALERLCEAHGEDETLYQALAGALGYKSNKLPFTVLAQRLPLAGLLKERGEADALLFGLSGFLPERELSALAAETRQYVRDCWERWWSRRAEYSRLILAPGLWRLSGQRPMNHPQRRLAALGQIVRHWRGLRQAMGRGEVSGLTEFFAGLRDPFWEHHYTLSSKASARPMALVGEARVTEMLVNVFLPLRAAENGLEIFRKLRAPLTNRRVEVAAARLLGNRPERREWLRSAALQQGLLQIYEDFCLQDASDCARCAFPRQIAQW